MQTPAKPSTIDVLVKPGPKRLVIAVLTCCALLALTTLPACSSERGRSDPTGTDGEMGHVSLALTGNDGPYSYRLTGAAFAITGPNGASAVSDEASDAAAISLALTVGDYTATLADGWILERKARYGAFAAVNARLTSPNPAPFTIAKDTTTTVSFEFDADGVPVQLATGNVDLTITVNTCDGSCPRPIQDWIGTTTVDFPRNGVLERTGETALGDLVADAMVVVTNSQLALIPGGSLRAPLPSSYVPPLPSSYVPPLLGQVDSFRRSGSPPFDLFVGDAHSVLPFGNHLVTCTITGQQLVDALEHGLSQVPAPATFFPQISGFSLTYATTSPHVQQLQLWNGAPLLLDEPYTITVDSFTAGGGDGYTICANDPQAIVGRNTTEALHEYIQLLGILTTPASGRIRETP